MTRTVRPARAYASVGALATGSPIATADEPDDVEVVDDLPATEDAPAASVSGASRLADVAKAAALKAERAIIEDTLGQVHWNRRRAAEQLGVSYKTLLNKIKECGISRK
jgi:DNA-binding NtrC family response regulator